MEKKPVSSTIKVKPEEMHAKALSEDMQTPQYDMSFWDYVMLRLNNFSGNNYIPRVVCSVLTKEYIILATRPKCYGDEYELPDVASKLKAMGYHVEVEDTNIAKLSNTMSMLVCWDPMVSTVVDAQNTIADPKSFQLYMTAIQYIRAEQSMGDLPVNIKDEMVISGVYTRKWVSLSLVSESMRDEAKVVGDFLWSKGYYVGIQENSRREGTWVMFICWDQRVVKRMGDHDQEFHFDGSRPTSWT